MYYGSVCSGIEAASVAWNPLGLKPAWFAEIEKFPCDVLAHHYPDVRNLGDMTRIGDILQLGGADAPDILVGGTPCQAFSVAGVRAGLEDPRGQLTLAFVDLADTIDEVRKENGDEPAIIVWENVPGVLSSKDNAFGCFLGALSGEDDQLQPPGKKWSNAGCVFGPKRAIAWRVLDAQYVGLAQRRKRVFVVASARDRFDPTRILFESACVRRDTPPSREAFKSTTETTDRGSWWDGGQLSQTLDAVLYKGQTMPEKNRFPAVLVPAIPIHDKATRHQGGGPTRSNDGSANGLGVGKDGDPYPTIGAHDIHAVCHKSAVRRITPIEAERLQGFPTCIQRVILEIWKDDSSPEYVNVVVRCTTAQSNACLVEKPKKSANALFADVNFWNDQESRESVVALHVRQGQETKLAGVHNRGRLTWCASGADRKNLFPPHTQQESFAQDIVLHALELANSISTGKGELPQRVRRFTVPSSGKWPVGIFGQENGGLVNVAESTQREVTKSITSNQGQSTQNCDSSVPTCLYSVLDAISLFIPERTQTGSSFKAIIDIETDYTLVPSRGKLAADGPRYKAIGNSMAVPCMRWIGERILRHLASLEEGEL